MTVERDEWQREVAKPKKAERVPGFAGCFCGALELVYADDAGVEVECSKCGAVREVKA